MWHLLIAAFPISLSPGVAPCKKLLGVGGSQENKSVLVGRGLFVNFQVILQLGGRLFWDHVSVLRTAWQSNNAIPGGSTGLGETCEEVAGPWGFQGN